jgi:DNA-binding protein YbaB
VEGIESMTDPHTPPVDEGQPGMAMLREADRLASALDDYQHQANNSAYTGTDEAGTVRATVTASFLVTDLIIDDELLALGSDVVARRVTEALVNAQAAATRGGADRTGNLLGALGLNAELMGQFDAAIKTRDH